ncbi:MAG: SUMF1/EgtB/PvdO family nonheme iron enzyme [Muribaculaceae bacterium]
MSSTTNVLPEGYILRSGSSSYRIESVLGCGGFGITYLATTHIRVGNLTFKEKVAIKEHFLSSACEREAGTNRVVYSNPTKEMVENSLKDFISEAKRLHKVGVEHPNIVKVNEVFEANNTAYYVMEYLGGKSLRTTVTEQGVMSEKQAVEVMKPVIDAVLYLHSYNMTHLDIKPDNIMLERTEDGGIRPVLIDFGLSKHYDKDGKPTSTIKVLGCSDGYAPVEQYAGITQFSPTADYYALGATMWYCLKGKDPKKSTDLDDGELAEEIAPISDKLSRFIAKACALNRNKRAILPIGAENEPAVGEAGENELEPSGQGTVKVKKGDKRTKAISGDGRKPKLGWIASGVVILFLIMAGVRFANFGGGSEEDVSDGRAIKITCETAGSHIYVDGQDMGAAPFEGTLSYGSHSVYAMNGAKKTAVKTVNVTEGTGAMADVSLSFFSPEKFEVNGVTFEMVYVPGGTFTMGATAEQGSSAEDDEKPTHSVSLSGYYIGKYEVTQAQWKAIMGNNPSRFKGDNLPVENVSWYDCQEFIRKLNQLTGKKFSLPTEAQWEYAARGGKSGGTRYSGSDNIGNVAWYGDNSGRKTHPVGKKSPNDLGIYDMSGNVYEWCQDWKGDYSSYSQTNPTGPGSGSRRVDRGGSWSYVAWYCRVSDRSSDAPGNGYDNHGFRLCLSISE